MGVMDFIRGKKKNSSDLSEEIEKQAYNEERLNQAANRGKQRARAEARNSASKPKRSTWDDLMDWGAGVSENASRGLSSGGSMGMGGPMFGGGPIQPRKRRKQKPKPKTTRRKKRR